MSAPSNRPTPPDTPSEWHGPGLPDDAYANRLTWSPGFFRFLKTQPGIAVTLGYLLLVAVGMWSAYWYFAEFGIPILEYMQIGDVLMMGLRDPISFGFLIYLLGFSLLALWPTYYWMQYPERVGRWRERRWGRWVFQKWASPFRRRRWFEISPEASILLGLLLGGSAMLMQHARERAHDAITMPDRMMRVTLAGASQPLQGEARLIGTTSTHVFLYWPGNGRTEAVSVEAVARLERWPRRIPHTFPAARP